MKSVSRKCKVIKTDCEEITSICLKPDGKLNYENISKPPIYGINHLGWKYQNLHITSDNEIFEGDYVIIQNNNKFFVNKVSEIKNNIIICHSDSNFYFLENCKKIIATNDPNLNLPSIPENFIQKYCKNDGKISQVLIKFSLHRDQHPEWRPTCFNVDNPPIISFLLPKLQGNEIIINYIF